MKSSLNCLHRLAHGDPLLFILMIDFSYSIFSSNYVVVMTPFNSCLYNITSLSKSYIEFPVYCVYKVKKVDITECAFQELLSICHIKQSYKKIKYLQDLKSIYKTID